MRRVARGAGVFALVVAAGVGSSGVGSSGALASGRAPARMLVYAQEWSLWSSRPTVPAGRVVVQLWNRGQDAHDLVVRRLSHGHMVGGAQGVGVTQSGALSQASWRLAPGRYELFCSMPGHLKKGMHTTLVVR